MFHGIYKELFFQAIDTQLSFEYTETMNSFSIVAVFVVVLERYFAVVAQSPPLSPVYCSPPRCPPGCTVQLTYSGLCPGCDCPSFSPPVPKVYPPFLCSPPKCPPGCLIDRFSAPCPSCECPPPLPPPAKHYCPPIGACSCPIAINYNGCRVCSCSQRPIPKPLCSTPRCRGPCFIVYGERPCPFCQCPYP